ncbi:MAG: hypothetical protein F6K47_11985 [Symploca sp. SIO2E6]|nr:hypothetical protein [Symploca sp. SIO2E6]
MSNIEQDAQLWIFNQIYGFNTIPPTGDTEIFTKAILICAKGDGVLSPAERNWVVGRAASLRSSGYELAKTYSADEALADVLANSSAIDKSGRRSIIYVAIQACAADGDFNQEERDKIHAMAQSLGIEEDVVNQIEEVCLEEAKTREKRIALLFPEGAPY